MKQYIKYVLAIALGSSLLSCADEFKSDFTVDKPESIIQYEYLNGYGPLKSYVNRTTDPNFKLGSGVTVSDFLKKELVYSAAVANFDELTTGNAMKYSSVVADNGSMNFSNVTKFVVMAREAGVGIYGHTLLWHAQQNNKYLNSLLADKPIEVGPEDGDKCLHINNPTAGANPWDSEIYYNLSTPLTKGVEYTISMRAKASAVVGIPFWPGDGTDTQYLPDFTAGTGWDETSITFTANYNLNVMRFCFGKFGGDIYFDDLSLKATGSDENLIANPSFDESDLSNWSKPSWHSFSYAIEAMAVGAASWWENLVQNSDCEGDDVSSFFITDKTGGPKEATFGAEGTGAGGTGRAIVVQSVDNPANAWATQFFVKVNHTFEANEKIRFSMKVKADKNAQIESQAQENPGGYLWHNFVGHPNVTTEWEEYTFTGFVSGEKPGANTIAFNLNVSTEATTYYFDDIIFEIEKTGAGIPLTPAEKKDTLTWALETWIAGMMEACDGYVKAWDVVNEPMSDSNASALKSAATESDPSKNFYWQDYLGKEYVRTAVKFARQYGGEDLILFANDYNLEATYNNNAKCEGLINMVKYWEEDGVTRIDGIGTQMHVSYNMDPAKQQKQEECIVKMYQLLAASGKLIKVTELDMGIVDAEGKDIKTANVTAEQHRLMSDFYKFIIKKYFEIIPAAQRYGIAHWSPTDSPANSGWRADSPIGLWDLNYNRKHTYAGFADGLAGK